MAIQLYAITCGRTDITLDASYNEDKNATLSNRGYIEVHKHEQTAAYPRFDLAVTNNLLRAIQTTQMLSHIHFPTTLSALGYTDPSESQEARKLREVCLHEDHSQCLYGEVEEKHPDLLRAHGAGAWAGVQATILENHSRSVFVVGQRHLLNAFGIAMADNNPAVREALRGLRFGHLKGFKATLHDDATHPENFFQLD